MNISLITSASYVVDELSAEFGRLPASFLPVGHQRLYDVQVQLLGPGTFLTLPESYNIPVADEDRLTAAGVNVIRVPDGLRLANSILYALEMIGETGAVRILHGDTIIYDLPDAWDVLAVGHAPSAYEWGVALGTPPTIVSGNKDTGDVLAGYFAFSDSVELRRSLARAQGDFVAAINDYRCVVPMADVRVSNWLDFGHLQTYYRSRCSIRIQRAFNEMDMSFQIVEKRSSNTAKIEAEAAWYESIPQRLRMYTPAFLGRGDDSGDAASYAIEYLPLPSLHELFVFGDLGPATWRAIIGSCFEFMEACAGAVTPLDPSIIRHLTVDKTAERLDIFLHDAGISRDQEWRYGGRALPSLHRIAETTAGLIDMTSSRHCGIMHGDLCFTNIFFDFRTQRIRVIDPRGTIDGTVSTVEGDVRYDLAKLNHSIVGAYDFILAGRYACSGFETRDMTLSFPKDSSLDLLNAVSREFQLRGLPLAAPETVAITIHLFLSMLPLHADRSDRQRAFVANALRLFAEMLEAE